MEHLRMGDDATMIVHETIGCYSANTGCCMFPPGTGQLMSFPMMPEYEYSIKVAMDGSNWAPPEPLDGDVPNSPWLLRAHVCGTQQIHEAVVSITTCTGAFGRSKLLKLEPHIVISNLTGFPIQLLQCIQPSQVSLAFVSHLPTPVCGSLSFARQGNAI